MAFVIQEARLGYLPIASVDSGVTPPNQSTAIPSPPMTLGQVVRAVDPTFGEGEFILLPGVASTVVGSLVTYSPTTFATALSPNTASQAQPVAVAMSANVAATTFGWYQIGGLATVKKTAVKVTPGPSKMYQSATTGRVMQTSASAKCILGAAAANLTTVTSTTSTVVVSLDRPHHQGPLT